MIEEKCLFCGDMMSIDELPDHVEFCRTLRCIIQHGFEFKSVFVILVKQMS